MEILKELPGGSFHDRATLNEKLKKRQRSSSPSAFSGGGDGGACSSIYNSSSLITWSSREEDEDMADVANSLILLARGGGVDKDAAKHNHHETARRFTDIPSTSSAKVGFYVYECKTCSRVFGSFQALGGHRASHKKPKLVAENNDHSEELQAVIISSKVETVVIASSPAKQQQLLVNNDISNTTNNKVHECSICGAEFASGQALGGHMRRHRSSLSLSTGKKECDDAKCSSSITRNVFVLDLNMPAPLEAADDHKPHATLLTPPPLVMLSGAKLVDCRY